MTTQKLGKHCRRQPAVFYREQKNKMNGAATKDAAVSRMNATPKSTAIMSSDACAISPRSSARPEESRSDGESSELRHAAGACARLGRGPPRFDEPRAVVILIPEDLVM